MARAGDGTGRRDAPHRTFGGFGPTRRLTGGLLLSSALIALPAAGQNTPVLTFGVSVGVSANSNADLSVTNSESSAAGSIGLDFGYTDATPIETLSISGNLRLRASSDDDVEPVDGPDLRLSYDRNGRDAQFGLDAFVRRDDIATLNPLSLLDEDGNELEGPIDLDEAEGSGTRLGFGLSTELELRRRAPLGVTLSAGYNGRRFSGGGVGDTDEDRYRAGVSLRFDLNDVTRARLGLSWSRFEEDIAGSQARDTYTLSTSVTRDLPTGSVGLSANATRTEEGERYGLRVTHSREIPLWTFSGSLGLAEGTSQDLGVVGTLQATRDLPSGRITANLTRDIGSGGDDRERQLTSLRLGYSTELSPLMGLNASVGYVETRQDGDTQSAGNINLGISRRLTDDMSVNLGLTHRVDRDAGGTARDNVLSLNLRRAISFRP